MKTKIATILTLLCVVLCSSCQKEESVVTSIALDKTTLSIPIGDNYQFTVSYLPAELQSPIYTWKSSNEQSVTVDDKGKIVTLSVGTSTITVSTATNLGASCVVTVTPINATGINLNKKTLPLFIDQEETLIYEILPHNTTDKTVIWSSDNDNVATVDNTGKIKAIGAGQTKIHVKLSNNISDVCDVSVSPIDLTGINFQETNKVIEETESTQLNIVFTPINATNKKIQWESSDDEIIVVSDKGVIEGKKIGNATITATSEDGGFVAICNVSVNLKGLTLSLSGSKDVMSNENRIIWVTSEATQEAYLGAIWSSSNPSVATIQSDGSDSNSAVITPNQVGKTIIKVHSSDYLKSAEYEINVMDITGFIQNKGAYSITSLSGGYLTGTCTSRITNRSNQTIKLKELRIISGHTGDSYQVYYATPFNTELYASQWTEESNIPISGWYKPIFRWIIEWNGQEYSFDEQQFK